MKNLIIAKKSSVAADIAKSLSDFKKMGGFFEREDLIITGAVGHLLALKVPADQDSDTLPLIPLALRPGLAAWCGPSSASCNRRPNRCAGQGGRHARTTLRPVGQHLTHW